ncbi:MAG: hypothetical protein OXG07_00360 [Anaerolineaceae bacterium]|nr:hypothetical protein [Anaerolineaceae bacterium]
MNDIPRAFATVVIWSVLGAVLIVLAAMGNDDLTGIAMFLVIGAIAGMGIVWGTAGRGSDSRRKAKRAERLAQRLEEEELDEEDLVPLEDLLEDQRATRRLRDD